MENLDPKVFPYAMLHPRNTSLMTATCRLVTLVTTIFALFCLYVSNVYKNMWYDRWLKKSSTNPMKIQFIYWQEENMIDEPSGGQSYIGGFCESIKMFRFSKELLMEIIILSICPIPFFDCYIYSDNGTNVYFLSEIMLALMSFRFYFIMRTWLN